MLTIAVDRDLGALYEGVRNFAQEVRPTPVIAPAAVVSDRLQSLSGILPAVTAVDSAKTLFREDSFDPVTRVRRGRLYASTQSGFETWHVPHATSVMAPRRVNTFSTFWVPQALAEVTQAGGRPLVLIGTDASYTTWSISSVEGTAHAEFMVTLRGRQTFGALPELILAALPAAHRQPVEDAIKKLGSEIFRAGPGSVVDRARDAASAILSGYLQDLGVVGPGEELATLIDKANALQGNQRKRAATSAADIVRIFHSREKPSVRERLPVHPVTEQDAELAAMCVASMLIELRWAKWP
jgi:hypothetical protein